MIHNHYTDAAEDAYLMQYTHKPEIKKPEEIMAENPAFKIAYAPF